MGATRVNNNKLQIPETNTTFPIKTYGFGELAQCYKGHPVTDRAASRWLHNEIACCRELVQQLHDLGYRKGQKTLTPRMVQAIVDCLGPPF